jgi:hypothetical protein
LFMNWAAKKSFLWQGNTLSILSLMVCLVT